MSEVKDYGEPWHLLGDMILNGRGYMVLSHNERIVACVNACAGIDNPESAIAAAREALELVRNLIDPELPPRIQGELLDQIDAALTLLAPERKETT